MAEVDFSKMKDFFFCNFCLEETESEGYPDICPACKVGYCQACGTTLKANAKFCYGCGLIPPEVKSTMYRTSSFAGAYTRIDWERRGCTGDAILTTAVGIGRRDIIKWMTKDGHTISPSEVVRPLTKEDEAILWPPK